MGYDVSFESLCQGVSPQLPPEMLTRLAKQQKQNAEIAARHAAANLGELESKLELIKTNIDWYEGRIPVLEGAIESSMEEVLAGEELLKATTGARRQDQVDRRDHQRKLDILNDRLADHQRRLSQVRTLLKVHKAQLASFPMAEFRKLKAQHRTEHTFNRAISSYNR